MIRKIALGILLASIATAASASQGQGETCKIEWLFGFIPIEHCVKSSPPSTVRAPEIDASSAVAGLTLMLGGLAILSGRRKKNIEG